MNKQVLKDLVFGEGIYDCLCDPYDKFNTGDPYGSVMYDLERFAEKVVRECIKICSDVEADTEMDLSDGALVCMAEIKEHFGVEG